jgi:predicted TIM-barrel fold metal-dependent hydrolase
MDYAIVDCHYHPAVDEETDCNWFGPSGTLRDQMEALKRVGITRACGAPIRSLPEPSFDEIRGLNERAFRVRDRLPDFYVPAIQVHPFFPEESCREVERCCGREGVRWIGELVGYEMGYGDDYGSQGALTIMRAAEEYRVPVNLHCGDLEVLERVCRTVPGLPIVLAHPSQEKETLRSRLACVGACDNLYLDISGSGISRCGMLRKAIDTVGKDKILFGTDYPINNPAVYVHGVLFEDLTEAERGAIFSGNFERLTEGARSG